VGDGLGANATTSGVGLAAAAAEAAGDFGTAVLAIGAGCEWVGAGTVLWVGAGVAVGGGGGGALPWTVILPFMASPWIEQL
jgi:hypothetical protein